MELGWAPVMIYNKMRSSRTSVLTTCLLGTAVVLLLYMVGLLGWRGREEVTSLTRKGQVGPFKGYKDCNKVRNIAFLKTHKCASSTVQNILMRFGVNNDLNFVLPSRGNYLGR